MSLEAEMTCLETLDLNGLRTEWERQHGEVLTLRSVELLRRMLAWRLQASVLGDLDVATRRTLRQQRAVADSRLREGSLLMREWQGRRYEVEVVEDGFVHDGRVWQSLSQVARHITGSRWNGPRFFGLRS